MWCVRGDIRNCRRCKIVVRHVHGNLQNYYELYLICWLLTKDNWHDCRENGYVHETAACKKQETLESCQELDVLYVSRAVGKSSEISGRAFKNNGQSLVVIKCIRYVRACVLINSRSIYSHSVYLHTVTSCPGMFNVVCVRVCHGWDGNMAWFLISLHTIRIHMAEIKIPISCEWNGESVFIKYRFRV